MWRRNAVVIALCLAAVPALPASAGSATCPWDCGIPHNKVVDVIDLLQLLAEWDPGSPTTCTGGTCDYDGSGCVDVIDLLELLGHYTDACPAPANDECAGKILLDRTDAAGTITEPFDMYGATASPEFSECLGADNTHKDVWYCLLNSTDSWKEVTVTGTVALQVEITEGCTCPPGALVACGPLAFGGAVFTMAPGAEVGLRLINDLGLTNDQLQGDLVIENQPTQPPDPVDLYLDSAVFFDAVNAAGKTQKLFWQFNPNSMPPAAAAFTAVYLDINTHGSLGGDPWTSGAGANLWPGAVDNLRFSSNLNPQGPFVQGGAGSMIFATAGFTPDIDTNFLSENVGVGGGFEIFNGLPAGTTHTAIAVALASTNITASAVTYRVTLYDKLDAQMAQFDIPGNTDDEIFAGFLTTDPGITIGRIDIFSLQGFFDGIAAVWAYTQPDPPLCDLPFACGGSSQQCIVGTACICLETPDGDYFCGNVQQPQCNSIGLCPGGDADCPPGSRCADFTCCGEPICLSECLTSPLPAKGPRAGPSEVPESPILGTAPR